MFACNPLHVAAMTGIIQHVCTRARHVAVMTGIIQHVCTRARHVAAMPTGRQQAGAAGRQPRGDRDQSSQHRGSGEVERTVNAQLAGPAAAGQATLSTSSATADAAATPQPGSTTADASSGGQQKQEMQAPAPNSEHTAGLVAVGAGRAHARQYFLHTTAA